jgi:hypothetical protein
VTGDCVSDGGDFVGSDRVFETFAADSGFGGRLTRHVQDDDSITYTAKSSYPVFSDSRVDDDYFLDKLELTQVVDDGSRGNPNANATEDQEAYCQSVLTAINNDACADYFDGRTDCNIELDECYRLGTFPDVNDNKKRQNVDNYSFRMVTVFSYREDVASDGTNVVLSFFAIAAALLRQLM